MKNKIKKIKATQPFFRTRRVVKGKAIKRDEKFLEEKITSRNPFLERGV